MPLLLQRSGAEWHGNMLTRPPTVLASSVPLIPSFCPPSLFASSFSDSESHSVVVQVVTTSRLRPKQQAPIRVALSTPAQLLSSRQGKQEPGIHQPFRLEGLWTRPEIEVSRPQQVRIDPEVEVLFLCEVNRSSVTDVSTPAKHLLFH